MKIDDGGPVFPEKRISFLKAIGDNENTVVDPVYEDIPGMSFRDYCAVNATDNDIRLYVNPPQGITRVEARYMYADTMIKARKNGGNNAKE